MTYRGFVPQGVWSIFLVAMAFVACAQLINGSSSDALDTIEHVAWLVCALLGLCFMLIKRVRGDETFGVGPEIAFWKAWIIAGVSTLWFVVGFRILFANS